jgi:molybdopterin-guanine dinucleotide biosynthesis protein A
MTESKVTIAIMAGGKSSRMGRDKSFVLFQGRPMIEVVVACDMPWLNRPLLEHMLGLRQMADVIVPRWQQYPEPLHAIYSKACLAAIEEKLREKRLKITAFFSQVKVHFVEREVIARFDADGRSFANINTPEELEDRQNKE